VVRIKRSTAVLVGVGGIGGLFALASTPLPCERDALAAAPSTASSNRKSDPGCLYGQVVDGHSGAVRCLSPQEVTPAGPHDTLPPEAYDAGVDSGRDGGHTTGGGARRDAGVFLDSSSAIPLRTISVSIEGLSFENGEVLRAPAALDRIKKDFARCAANEPLPLKSDATLDLRFLVRAPGRAEGVDVVQARGMSVDIVRCVTSQLAGRQVGSPSTDPVAVALTVRFKRD
jgi:hypothetical protein